MKRFFAMVMALLLIAGVAGAETMYFSETAIRVGDTCITPEELEAEVQRRLICSALDCAERGMEFDTVDSLNIIDAMDKTLFDVESALVIRFKADEMGLGLAEEDWEKAAQQAQKEWDRLWAIACSENGMAFLPAGTYTPVDDPEESLTLYLASWGLTWDALYRIACDDLLYEKVREQALADMDVGEDEVWTAFSYWFLDCWEEIGVEEEALAVAEVCLALKGDYHPYD